MLHLIEYFIVVPLFGLSVFVIRASCPFAVLFSVSYLYRFLTSGGGETQKYAAKLTKIKESFGFFFESL